jgi:hypothetical protein
MSATVKPISRTTQLEIIHCSICDELFLDPRTLPCQHTFCLKCIARLSIDQAKYDTMACPLCGVENRLPENGVGNLPKNIFIRKLIMRKDVVDTSNKRALCDACCADQEEDDGDEADINFAEEYCVECKLKLCKGCKYVHHRSKNNRLHKFVKLNTSAERSSAGARLALDDSCSAHSDEKLTLYCYVCKTAICLTCFDLDHMAHRCSSIKLVQKSLQRQMTTDIVRLSDVLENCHRSLARLEKSRKILAETVFNVQNEVRQEAERLKCLIDQDEKILLLKLSPSRKKVEKVSSELRRLKDFLRVAKWSRSYIEEVRSKGTAVDVARQWRATKQLKIELLKFNPEGSLNDFGLADIVFTASDLLNNHFSKNVVGEINMKQIIKGIENLSHLVFIGIGLLSESGKTLVLSAFFSL